MTLKEHAEGQGSLQRPATLLTPQRPSPADGFEALMLACTMHRKTAGREELPR